ncbi:hypothetical protein [Sphingopyxis sp. LK2115]|uniref:hypothetical protein n=1 Tax=Sphingopyxis sp. LK2115 TaxID=2744558 RepID=UPI0016616EED|nr:hypothetical protein [Sphingopyxis sp. LK2115]
MRDWNTKLETIYTSLRNVRGEQPVFALEHGLDPDELKLLSEVVGAQARRVGISGQWAGHALPLIVVATEVGYEYRGTGSDYWPLLERELGASISTNERKTLTGFFLTAHRRLGLKRPVDSPWTRTFPHISWPIANAIAPREIQRPLARALQQVVRIAPAGRQDADFAEDLRYVARNSTSGRFREWVEDQNIARSLIFHLLDLPDPDSRLSTVTVARLIRDLETDRQAADAIRKAVATHRQRRRIAAAEQTPLGIATFILALNGDGEFNLTLCFPLVSASFRNRLATALTGLPQGAVFWGCIGPIRSDLVLSGMEMPIADETLGAALIAGRAFCESTGIDGGDPLADLAPAQSLPLLFRKDPMADRFVQIRETELLEDDQIVVLTDRAFPIAEGIVAKQPVCGLTCLELDLRETAARAFAERLGLHPPGLPVASFAGGIHLSEGWRGPIYATSRPLLLKSSGTRETAVSVSVDEGEPVQLAPGQVAALEPVAGEHLIRLGSGQGSSVSIVTFIDVEPVPAAFDAITEPPEPTLDDLVAGRLVIRITTPSAIEQVPVQLSLHVDGTVVTRSEAMLNELPSVLHGGSAVMADLADRVTKRALARNRRFYLRLRLGRYWSKTWETGWSQRTCDWIDSEGTWRAFAEDTPLSIVPVPLSEPLSDQQTLDEFSSGEQITLLIPTTDSTELIRGARIVGPPKLALTQFRCNVPSSLSRYVRASDAGPGLSRLLDRYVAWSIAEPGNLVLAAASRAAAQCIEGVLVRMLCGEAWSQEEGRLERFFGSRFRALAEFARDEGLLKGEYLPELQPDQLHQFFGIFAAEIEKCWDPEAPATAWVTEDFAGDMDTAVIEAFGKFGALLPPDEQEPFLDADILGEPRMREWARAARKARKADLSGRIADLLLPASRASALRTADYDRLTSDELVRALDAVHLDLHSRNMPRWLTREHLQFGFWLWTAPSQLAATTGWKPALERLIDDRPTARAIRYAALRFRAARGIGSGGSPADV